MMSGAKHYLDFELKEPAIDAMVDTLTGEKSYMSKPEAPMMENIGKGEKKLTKDELKEIIKKSINEGDIDEGFFDRLKANIKGITAKTSTTFGNLKAFVKGDKDAIKDPKLAQNMAKLQQKAKTLDSELTSVMKDMSLLFPKDVIAKTPEEFQNILNQYTGMLDVVKTLNTQISTGEFKPTTTSSPKTTTPSPSVTPPPATSTTTTARPSASVADKLIKAKTPTSGKTYNYKGKDYPIETDSEGSFIRVDGTKVTVQSKFDPNIGVGAKPDAKPTQARDEKGRFVSTKKVAEILAKKLKSK